MTEQLVKDHEVREEDEQLEDREQLAATRLLARLEPDVAARLADDRDAATRWRRARAWLRGRVLSLAVLAGLLVTGALLHGVNMLRSPDPNEDEATYISQAMIFAQTGELSHYTYWYDHPPLGWILVAGSNQVLALFGVTDVFVAGRIAMLGVQLANIALLFGILRRLGVARWAGALGVLVFMASPLGIDLHRLTLLDNIGTPFVLLGWFWALDPRRRLSAYAWSAFALALAVLIKETHAMFVPPVVAHVFFATRANRRYAVPVTLSLGAFVVGLYPLYAVLKREFLPGPDHVSLFAALKWQLVDRPSDGWALDAASASGMQFNRWLTMDWPLLLGGLVATVLVLLLWRRATWLAVTYLVLWVVMLRGGYVPLPFPINLVWPASLLIGVAAHAVVAAVAPRVPAGRHAISARHWPVWRLVACALVVVLGAGMAYAGSVRAYDRARWYFIQDRVAPTEQVSAWIGAHVGRDEIVVADNVNWVQLVMRGYDRHRVIWCYKLDEDPEVMARLPNGWRDVDYVISTGPLRGMAKDYPTVQQLLANSTPVATFDQGIEVRRVNRP